MERTSVWVGTARSSSFPALEGDIEADVAIVGGGITGLTAAKLLSEQGRKVALLEAYAPGAGATGHSTGNLYVPLSNGLHAVRAKWGDATLRAVARSRAEAIDFIERTAQAEGIACGFARCAWHCYTTADGKDRNGTIEQEHEALRAAGFDVRYVDVLPLPVRVERGIRLDHQAQFDPYAYAQGLAHRLRGRGVPVYGRSAVTAIDAGTGTVSTARGTVRCRDIVLATHTPKGVHAVQTQMEPAMELGIACRLADDRCPPGIYWGLGRSMHSLRGFETGGRSYLVAIGDRFATGKDEDVRRRLAELDGFVRAHFAFGSIDYAWAAQHFRAADALPYIGTARGSDKVHIATGFFTDGLVYGTLAAMIIADRILGRENPWARTYEATRIAPMKSAKGTVKETLNVVAHLAQDYLMNRHAAALERIAPGAGGLIDTDQGTVAVYRDPQGRVSAVSARCTHMGCRVHWNEVERTWDCPCHGSRFDTGGAVIEGPALAPLAHAPAP